MEKYNNLMFNNKIFNSKNEEYEKLIDTYIFFNIKQRLTKNVKFVMTAPKDNIIVYHIRI